MLPKTGLVGAALGLNFLAPFEPYVYIVIQILVIAALLGHVWAFPRRRNADLLALAAIGTLAVLSAYHYSSCTWSRWSTVALALLLQRAFGSSLKTSDAPPALMLT